MDDPREAGGLIDGIGQRAANADRRDGFLGEDIAALREQGWLHACLPTAAGGAGWGCEPDATRDAFDALRALGGANLSVARLFEGHMNAVKLVDLYAGPEPKAQTWDMVSRGGLLGVWGADVMGQPLVLNEQDDVLTLSGSKRFASGLHLVGLAVVTAAIEGGTQLLLVPTEESARADRRGWTTAGMRATQSGSYGFEGLVVPPGARLGQVDDYYREPHFEGGIWRYCAAHLGAAEALFHELRAALVASGRAGDPHQEGRIVRAAIAIETARLWILRAALAVEAADAAPGTATLSLLGRDVTETSCLAVLDETERALGMAAHVEGTRVERIRRDLALFLCQAAPDAKRSRAAKALVERGVLPEDL